MSTNDENDNENKNEKEDKDLAMLLERTIIKMRTKKEPSLPVDNKIEEQTVLQVASLDLIKSDDEQVATTEEGNKGQTKKEELTFYERIKPAFVDKMFALCIGAILIFLLTDYYTIAGPYLDFGADQALVSFAGMMVILLVLAMRFYRHYSPRVKNRIHLILLFIIPVLFIEVAAETYLRECGAFSGFDNWFDNYTKGRAWYTVGDNKKARYFFMESMKKIDVKDKKREEVLAMKSMIYLAKIEAEDGNGNKEKALKGLASILERLPKISAEEKMMVTLEMAKLYNYFGDHQQAMNSITETFLWMRKINEQDVRRLVIDAYYEKVLAGLHLLGKKSGLTLLNDQDLLQEQMDSILKDWQKVGDAYIMRMTKSKNKVEQKLILLKLMSIIDLLYEKKENDTVLQWSFRVLEVIRDKEYEDELIKVYSLIADIYDRKGLKEKSNVYIKLLEERGVQVEKSEK